MAACGSNGGVSNGSASLQHATLVLDYLPGPVHSGIYYALEQGYYKDEGIDLRIIEPTSTADTLKLMDAGKADFGIADGIDVAEQIAQGRSAKGIMALTQKPSGAVIVRVKDNIKTPAGLDGGTVGWTGVPSDKVIAQTVIKGGGGDLSTMKFLLIGFNGVQDLTNGKIDGFVGFGPADGVQLDVSGVPSKSFMLSDYGGPEYPGLVVFSTEEKIASEPKLMQGFVSATIKGYEEGVLKDWHPGIDALLKYNPTIPKDFAEAGVKAYLPLYVGSAKSYGLFQTDKLEELSTFLVKNGLIKQPITPDRYATNEFVQGQ
jgi:ABC-type nitrate/sulfonate/bicarbonate transport system substrate-binding protein